MTNGRRRACVLMPLFSMRGRSGFGLGEISDIPRFARWARSAGFRMLQLLPVNEVCGGETSPYAAATAFALDPVYLALDDCQDFVAAGGRGALTDPDRQLLDRLADSKTVRWGEIRPLKMRAAKIAFARFVRDEWSTNSARAQALYRFRKEHPWLHDHAVFSVLHDRFQTSWMDWPTPLRDRVPAALAAVAVESLEALSFNEWLQWQLDEQWHAARREAAAVGVELMGDLPFMVSGDSSDVWAQRENFRLDLRVGTPPDAFSAEGQDWGLPVYDWAAMERTNFAWMRARARRSGDLFDAYRVDHVIGLYRTFYRSNDKTQSGFTPTEESEQIRIGETMIALFAEAGEVVGEDLGMVPPFLRPSLVRLGVPGYRVLRWEKDEIHKNGERRDVYRDPATWPEVSVAASGTHDIETNAEWYDALSENERAMLAAVPGLESLLGRAQFDDHVRDALLRVLYASPSEIVAIPFQDALGSRERVNVPGTVNDQNWTYRMPMDIDALLADGATRDRLARLSAETGRG